ncbi:MAG: alpha/beta hydrolase [archaeon]
MHALIVHGAEGHPGENWFPWLRGELEKIGIIVRVPHFPQPQSLGSWTRYLEASGNPEGHPEGSPAGKDSMLIGHSVGCAFILALLERFRARAAFLAAPFTGRLGIPYDRINRSFVEREFNWEAIMQNCRSFFLYSSDNDPYVPLKHGFALAVRLQSNLNIMLKNVARRFWAGSETPAFMPG